MASEVKFASDEQRSLWIKRVNEIAPWAWESDPYLEGMTKEQFDYIRSLPMEEE